MSAPPLSLVIRADATARIGAGHVMRSLALARAWRRTHGPVTVWGEVSLPFVLRRLADAAVHVQVEKPAAADVLVVDSYDATARASGASDDSSGVRVLVDDFGGTVPTGYHAVWHPGPAIDAATYHGFAGLVLAGASVVPLRDALPEWRPTTGAARAAAVMLGGTRIAGPLAGAVAAASDRADGWRFVGLGDWTPPGWTLLDADDPWAVASTCDCLVTAAGTTLFEAAAVGIPTVALQTADNQSVNAEWARSAGVPLIDLTAPEMLPTLPEWLPGVLGAARPLPVLRDGSPSVADALATLALETLAGRRRCQAAPR